MVLGLIGIGAGVSQRAGAESIEDRMVEAWKVMRQAEPESTQFNEAGVKLLNSIGQLPASKRIDAATALMDRYAPGHVNCAALAMFGSDAVDLEGIRRILFDTKRSFAQRVLIRTYYDLCHADYGSGYLTESDRLGLMSLLTDRIKSLTGTGVSYGEQRLLTHLTQAMFSRYGRKSDEFPQVRWLTEAMDGYVAAAAPADSFALAARGWMDLIRKGGDSISNAQDALAALGHWDPLIRWQASRYLGALASENGQVVIEVQAAMSDGRDEVRAAAIEVFALATGVAPETMIPKLVEILTRDRGVVAQAAASFALTARRRQATGAIDPLLDALEAKTGRRPGRKRTDSMLRALAALTAETDASVRARMLHLAVGKLTTAPDGALKLLASLGTDAAPALPSVEAFRVQANRFQRQYIDRHVLPAINTEAVARP